MILISLYITATTALITVAAIGTVLYRRYLADKPRRARNALRVVQMAVCAAVGAAQIDKIRGTSFGKSKAQRTNKALQIAKSIINTVVATSSIAKDIEPAPVYRYD